MHPPTHMAGFLLCPSSSQCVEWGNATVVCSSSTIGSCLPACIRAGEGMSPDKTQWGDQFLGHLSPPMLSKTDEHFRQQGIEFVESRDGIIVSELNSLFEKVSA